MDGLRHGRRGDAPGRAGSTSSGGRPRACATATGWFAAEASRDPKTVLRGRLEALGPVQADSPQLEPDAASLLVALEAEGAVLRTRIDGRAGLVRPAAARAHPPLHARPPAARDRAGHRGGVPALPRAAGSTSTPSTALEGPRGVAEVVRQLAGFEVPAARVGGEHPPARACAATGASGSTSSTLSGEVAWGRLWGARPRGRSAARRSPSSRARTCEPGCRSRRSRVRARRRRRRRSRCAKALAARGALFTQELLRATRAAAGRPRGEPGRARRPRAARRATRSPGCAG